MDNYIEQINNLREVFEKINFQDGIKCCEEQIKEEGFRVGVIGINLRENLEIRRKLSLDVSNVKFLELALEDRGTRRISTSCDIVIQVIDAVQPVTKGDYNLYNKLSQYYNNIVFIVDRLKYIDEEEIDDSKNYIEEKLSLLSRNKSVFYIEEDSSYSQLVEYLREVSVKNSIKINIQKFKLHSLYVGAIKFLQQNINLLENWEVEKNKKIEEMSSNINKLYFYGEGFALYFNRYKDRLNNYISEFGKEDITYIHKCFNDLISSVQGCYKKYLRLDIENINILNLEDKKYSSTPYLFIEDLRMIINRNIQHIINKINNDIEELQNKCKDIQQLNILKECYTELIIKRKEISYE